jgi:hypothetical protein
MIDVQCNLCGADDYVVRFPATLQPHEKIEVDAFSCTNPGYGHHAQIVACRQCGHVYANPRWSGDEILEAYTAVTDQTYVQERAGRELTFQKHLRAMEKRVGQARRPFPARRRRVHWRVCRYGVPGWLAGVRCRAVGWAASVAQRQGLNVIHGTQDAPELVGQQFDVVTMWDVIEHVADPSGEIGKAYGLLKPGGWVVIHTMDISSLIARLMGARWPWLMDMHIHYFSQKTLGKMLQKNGFEVIWSGAEGRYLRLNYFVSRVTALNRPLGRLTGLGGERPAAGACGHPPEFW